MPNDKRYNGWTSYETWAVKLWIDNEEPMYRYWRERTQSLLERPESYAGGYGERPPQNSLADELKSEFRNNAPELGASVWADLLGSALDNVSWDEIAEAMINEVKE